VLCAGGVLGCACVAGCVGGVLVLGCVVLGFLCGFRFPKTTHPCTHGEC
jgi:hypothetical protein